MWKMSRPRRQTNGHNLLESTYERDEAREASAVQAENGSSEFVNFIESKTEHHHHHTAARNKAWHHELILYVGFLLYFLFGETILLMVNYHEVWSSDVIFIMVILKSTYYDMAHGPPSDNTSVVKVKIRLMVTLCVTLFVLIFLSSCVTSQFVVKTPVEFQVYDEDGHVVETVPLWRWHYKGFHVVYGPFSEYFINPFGDEGPTDKAEDIYENVNYAASAFNAMIHVFVCASKFAVVRYILLSWELVIKSLTRRIRKW